jgi:uncharacterized MAPEG superfamily protein
MSPTLVALVGFATWTALLVFGLAGLRAAYAQRTGKALNSFQADGSDLEGLTQRWTRVHLNCLEFLPIFAAVGLAGTQRWTRVHLNCLEFLPIFAAVGLAGVVAGKAVITDPLAMPLLYLRVGQSVAHLISTAVPFVMIRATLFVGQVLIVLYWSFSLLTG